MPSQDDNPHRRHDERASTSSEQRLSPTRRLFHAPTNPSTRIEQRAQLLSSGHAVSVLPNVLELRRPFSTTERVASSAVGSAYMSASEHRTADSRPFVPPVGANTEVFNYTRMRGRFPASLEMRSPSTPLGGFRTPRTMNLRTDRNNMSAVPMNSSALWNSPRTYLMPSDSRTEPLAGAGSPPPVPRGYLPGYSQSSANMRLPPIGYSGSYQPYASMFQSKSSLYPVTYFLYGATAKPRVIKQVLRLGAEPKLREAKIVGFERIVWGDRETILPADDHNADSGETLTSEVLGVIYTVTTPKEEQDLEKLYLVDFTTVLVDVHVLPQGPQRLRMVEGKTFMYTAKDFSPTLGLKGTTILSNPLNFLLKFGIGDRIRKAQADIALTGRLNPPPKNSDPRLPNHTPSSSNTGLLRTPSLRAPNVNAQPTSYHGPSIYKTETMLRGRSAAMEVAQQSSFQLQELRQSVEDLEQRIRNDGGEIVRKKHVHWKSKGELLREELKEELRKAKHLRKMKEKELLTLLDEDSPPAGGYSIVPRRGTSGPEATSENVRSAAPGSSSASAKTELRSILKQPGGIFSENLLEKIQESPRKTNKNILSTEAECNFPFTPDDLEGDNKWNSRGQLLRDEMRIEMRKSQESSPTGSFETRERRRQKARQDALKKLEGGEGGDGYDADVD
ncbi:hypothetical protein P154DRAFT_597222 [Amniculicola lignicola CBS 123094]|uniref:Gamma-glutamylcyclotransferase AIG2-like domain-containing protein n=1 Tax=Amniculicola lignicola CBS 123094 TaxID=1392246 RepID=A0A6A5X0I8_9PLEO|nr:hypothetical protein P154DRAFT_597222 [Amniculicola lignicola CBS 123094]